MISTDLGNLDVGIQSEPTAGVPNDRLMLALKQDMQDKLEVCKLGCGNCPRGLNCQTLGNPNGVRYSNSAHEMRASQMSAFPGNGIPKPSSHLAALSYIEQCHRPLGMASRVGVNLFVKQEYMWGTPLVPIRAKLRVMGNMMCRLEKELDRQYVASDKKAEHLYPIHFHGIEAIKKTVSDTSCFIDKSEAGDLVRKLFRDNASQPAIAHAFRACCCRLPELIKTGWLVSEGWATYWAFASDCREAGLGMARETVVSVHDSRIVTVPDEELQRQIGELAEEIRK